MKKLTTFLGLALSAAVVVPAISLAADHIDSPAAVADPSGDITDLFAWMSSDASKVNLVLNVSPFAGTDSTFSDALQYVFHVNSSSGYGEAQTETLIICQFDSAGVAECWAGADNYAKGDASGEQGITTSTGAMKVFTGLRNDPFFMEFTGFTNAVSTVVGAAAGLTFDAEGCPALDEPTSSLLVGQLQSGLNGAAATDTFAGANVLSIVVQVDKEVVTPGGSIVSVWASTHSAR